jgi:IS5 family transposase
VSYFARTSKKADDKILSFHTKEVACITKNKPGKPFEFGRQVQIGRLDNNFMFALNTSDPHFSDKQAICPFLKKFKKIFGFSPNSFSADRGYFSYENVKLLEDAKVKEIGLQAPSNILDTSYLGSKEIGEKTYRRRAGIEPLIGHLKRYGLAKSRMREDRTSRADIFRCCLGFNLNKLGDLLEKRRQEEILAPVKVAS